ncbi:Nucleotidylyl transferase [Biscogniauxia mediterranea]|nr:Nucleotidylyl transferase [Biscogniauxia mediterranea]
MPSSSSPASFPPNLVPLFAQALKNYQLSGSRFRVLCSLPPPAAAAVSLHPPPRPPRHPPRSLLILDSSFNPPTLAHQRMVLSAYSSYSSYSSSSSSLSAPAPAPRILLLLAINNADKAPKPAAFPQRLAMMYVFAQDLLDALAEESETERGTIVDIAVTTEPYFHAKSEAIARSGFYRGRQVTCTSTSTSTSTSTTVSAEEEKAASSETEQIFLVGFDTLVRILDPKYYYHSPPSSSSSSSSSSNMRAALDPLFARARLRVTARPGAGASNSIAAQRGYLASLTEQQPSGGGGGGEGGEGGTRIEQLGGRAEWARHRIDMVVEEEGEGEGREVSSTLARAAARRRDWEALRGLVSPRVKRWVREEEEGEGVYGGAIGGA